MKAIYLTAISLLIFTSCKNPGSKKWEHPIYVVDIENKQCRERKPLNLEAITWQDPVTLPLESCESKICVTPEAYNDGKRGLIYYRKELRECQDKKTIFQKDFETLQKENTELKNQIHSLQILLMNSPIEVN